ncbi:hypothetical protein ABPG75_012945 [Micractinium tetrahymenae]
MVVQAAASLPVALHRVPSSRGAAEGPAAGACHRLPARASTRTSLKHHKRQQRQASPCRSAAGAGVATTAPTTDVEAPDAAAIWEAFAASVSGEWEGVTASFNPDGSPIPLPEYYVPQAYRDWGVELFDWQSQSSVLADSQGVSATCRRMMPTVGCEADAIAFMQEAAQLFSTAPGSQPATAAPDGSYSAGPADISSADLRKVAFEHCLALPAEGPQQQRMRLRVVQQLRRGAASGGWRLDSVELHSERYDSPYRGKLELSGCGGGMKGFASSEALPADALAGAWQVASGLRYQVDPTSGACSCSAAQPGERWEAGSLQGVLLHPLRAWSACSMGDQDGGDVSLAAGVLLGEGGARMAVAVRRLAGGRLASVELLTLERA